MKQLAPVESLEPVRRVSLLVAALPLLPELLSLCDPIAGGPHLARSMAEIGKIAEPDWVKQTYLLGMIRCLSQALKGRTGKNRYLVFELKLKYAMNISALRMWEYT